jgi:cysteinyl-tRNA synthetase
MHRVMLYNTLSRSLELFTPYQPQQVGLYCCGPTVYNYAHIGNLRTYIFEDILRRTLQAAGYQVKHIMNITDIGHLSDDGDDGEDKMVRAARQQGMNVWQIAQFFTQAFFDDCQKLHILPPHIAPAATQHIDGIIAQIQTIVDAGYTYISNGNLYFDTSKDANYGVLRGYGLGQHGYNRVDTNANKRNPEDFVLWFTQSKFIDHAMYWPSPWGQGYPGWHIECSSLSTQYLGQHFDIHCGGIDHIGIHHTNEMAQNRACYQHYSARYWLHAEFLTLDHTKMSKSDGSFLTLSKLQEAGFHALDYRYFCLGAHYRKPLAFHYDALTSAKQARHKILQKITHWQALLSQTATEAADKAFHKMTDRLCQDLNTPEALAVVWETIKNPDMSDIDKVHALFMMDKVLQLGLFIEPSVPSLSPEIEQLLQQRTQARQDKNYAESDRIRDLLLEKGIVIKDTKNGQQWDYKS